VISVGGHDTASAFAAVPVSEGEHAAFLSSGTWSLMGTELDEPVISRASMLANFTNEVGVCDTIRLLKNMTGLWMLQELRRVWNEGGSDYTWKDMDKLAEEAEPLRYFFNPADPVFSAPGDMPSRIQEYCERTGQGRPEARGAIIRATYENLALLYADTFQSLEEISGKSFDLLRIVGGGSKNTALNQFTANALGIRVVTGPVEATAIGNLTVQMLAVGELRLLEEGRSMVRASFCAESKEYEPQESDVWKEALAKWRRICLSEA
jgi:sugar (pentulose or hexulose) kinase